MNTTRQRHPDVPSSNQPPIPEWAGHLWYMIRVAALQAREDLDDNTAAHLVNFMASLAVVTPCPKCRQHFAEDWADTPFTLLHAKSSVRAINWVEELHHKVDVRVRAEKAAAGAAAATSAATAAATAAVYSAPVAHAAPVAPSIAMSRRGSGHVSTATSRRAVPGPINTPAMRPLAVRSALHVAQANHAGRHMGCNCAKRGTSK